MRPLDLTVEGFTAYREPTTIDFSDTDYFALVGPTGSGKSSVIDAICFALYGSVPRYDDQRLVGPAITQGALEAKVSLRFSLHEEEYTATRVVRRSGGAPTTKEARLERGVEVLAGTVKELDAAVPELLGLTFDQFTRCVVLPQGEFARFLHDDPGTRQDLLVKLLGLGVYEVMMQAANQRAKNAKALAEVHRRDLEERFAGVDESQRKEAKAKFGKLRALRDQVKQAQPNLQKLAKTIEDRQATASLADEVVSVLAGLRVPEGIAQLSRAVADASKALASAKKEATAARQAVKKAEERRKALGEEKPLLRFAERYDDLDRVQDELTKASKELSSHERAAAQASKAVAEAEAREVNCRLALDALRARHAAHEAAAALVKGEPCPVCGQVVTELAKRPKPAAVSKTQAALKDATQAVKEAHAAERRAREALVAAKGRVDTLNGEIARLKKQLASAPPVAKLQARLRTIEEADETLEAVREAQAEKAEAVDEAEHDRDVAQEAVEVARADLEEMREQLAVLRPPKADTDLVAGWKTLAKWASATATKKAEERDAAIADAAEATEERDALVKGLLESCNALGLKFRREDEVADVVVEAVSDARHQLNRISEILNDAKKARRELKANEREAEVADRLGYHLARHQGRFPSWLLREALDVLAASASEILGSLSSGRYALAVDDKDNFVVVDHHNADEARPAKTLSGGETFLASLALALALSEHVVDLAAEGASLGALFLDEGFGTLDAETLDTVASTIETLGASGRTVGLVTHVRELAERIPVRFEVRRDGRTARIDKVYA